MKKKGRFLLIFLLMLILTPALQAATFSFNLDLKFSGDFSPSGTTPWLTATFTDQVASAPFNVVQLDLSTPGISSKEFVSNWFFNLNPSATIPPLFYFDKSSPSKISSLPVAINSLLPDSLTAGNAFDFLFTFPTVGSELFSGNKAITYFIEGVGISSSLFNALNETGSYYTAAEVRRIGETIPTSWIADSTLPAPTPNPDPNPVPEPGTMLLFGFGLIGLAFSGGRNLLK